jgi:hypothetical protein
MLSKQEQQQERLDVLRNEQRLRDQASTLSQFAESDAATTLGRFSAISSPVVVGANAIPKYPAAYLNHDPVPDEPCLGVSVDAMEPVGENHELKATVPSDLGPSLLGAQAPPGLSVASTQETSSARPDAAEHGDPLASPPPGSAAGRRSFSPRSYRRF